MNKKEMEQFIEDTNTKIAILKHNQEIFSGQVHKLKDRVDRMEDGFIKLLGGFLESQGKGK